jgi:hypothetical protein
MFCSDSELKEKAVGFALMYEAFLRKPVKQITRTRKYGCHNCFCQKPVF